MQIMVSRDLPCQSRESKEDASVEGAGIDMLTAKEVCYSNQYACA